MDSPERSCLFPAFSLLLLMQPTIGSPLTSSSNFFRVLPPARAGIGTFFSPQQRLRQPRRSAEQITSEKFEFVDKLLGGLGPFESLGEFLAFVFFNRVHGETDPRGESHAIAVAKFLRGSTTIRMSHILPLIYKHRNSFPSINSLHSAEQNDMFSDAEPPKDIRHARPFISTWALRLTAAEARKQIWDGNSRRSG
ncbi:hypothetical protein B0H14DRAFT_2621422 [Mycena olivaceomarginata]|nr:hypothetical protein B0H14DRAFT_2621422 [Mycena olivaceomarginata]